MSSGRAAAALCCGALVLLPGCGGGGSSAKKIPADQASRLIKNVQAADQYSQNGLCTRAHTKVRDARFVLSQVPTSVKSSVRQGIADGLGRLDSLITSECERPQTHTDTTPTDTTPTTQSQTTPTTSQTQTTPTQTTPTQTTPTQTTPTATVPTGTTTGGNGGTPPAGTGTTP